MKKKLLTIMLTIIMVSQALPVTIFADVHDSNSVYFTNVRFDWKDLKVSTDDTGNLTGVSAAAWFNYDNANSISGRDIGFYIAEKDNDPVEQAPIILNIGISKFNELMNPNVGMIELLEE